MNCICFRKKDKKKGIKNMSKLITPNNDNLTKIKTEDGEEIDMVKNGKFLVCDDASTNRMVLRRYLELKQCKVDEANNGYDAIEKIKENGIYDIIWMDIQMPKMDGLSAAKKIRNEYNYTGTIIGLTGYVDPKSFKDCLEAGMNHVISKPIDKNVLYMYVDKYGS